MTIDRDASGSAQYTPPSGINADVYGLARPPVIAPVQGQINGARYSVAAVDARKYPGLYKYSLEIYDLRGPSRQQGRFDLAHNATSTGDADTRFEGVATASLLTTAATTPALADGGDSQTIYSTNYLGQMVLSIATNSHVFLINETSATNPALQQIVYDHAGRFVTGLASITMNNIDYLAVMYSGQAVELLSDLVTAGPTVAGSMNAATASTYGMIQTTLPNRPILMHTGYGIYSIPSNVAIGTAPTLVTTVGAAGGYAVGLLALGGGNLRAWWNWARRTGITVPGGGGPFTRSDGTYDGMVVSTDQLGSNAQELKLPFAKVIHTAICRNGLVVGDFMRLGFHNGRTYKDLRLFDDQPANSDRLLRVTGVWTPNQQELFAEVNELASASGTGDTRRCIRRYDFDLDHWTQVSAWTTKTAYVGIESYIGAGPLPYSPITGYLHSRLSYDSAGPWLRKYEPPPGTNPYSLRKTSGAQAGTGSAFESTVTWTGPVWEIPGLEGQPKCVTRVIGPPTRQIASGGSGATMSVAVMGHTSTFGDTEPSDRCPVDDFQSEWGTSLQVTLSATQQSGGTDPTRYTVQLLPTIIEGYCYREPIEIPGDWKGSR